MIEHLTSLTKDTNVQIKKAKDVPNSKHPKSAKKHVNYILKIKDRDFPGGTVVKTPCSQ